jgi:hypothetical protein
MDEGGEDVKPEEGDENGGLYLTAPNPKHSTFVIPAKAGMTGYE